MADCNSPKPVPRNMINLSLYLFGLFLTLSIFAENTDMPGRPHVVMPLMKSVPAMVSLRKPSGPERYEMSDSADTDLEC